MVLIEKCNALFDLMHMKTLLLQEMPSGARSNSS